MNLLPRRSAITDLTLTWNIASVSPR